MKQGVPAAVTGEGLYNFGCADSLGLAGTGARSTAGRCPDVPVSCQAYERLLRGEIVAWEDIVREHRLLGLITVPQLIKAGVVRVHAEKSRSGRHLCKYEPHGSTGS